MMCEECGLNPAKFHFVSILNGERTEKNLCPACMAKYKQDLPGIDIKNLAGILNNLLEGRRSEGREGESEETLALNCPQCGMTYAEFKKGGMVGCAECYQAFREPMTALLQRIHGNTQHAGRIPGGAKSSVSIRMSIERLKQQLTRAVADEEYEQAAKLRDAIRALNAQLEQQKNDIHVAPPERIASDETEKGGEDNA